MVLFQIIFTVILVGIPIVLWGYVFSYFDGTDFRMKKFFTGVLAGALSVIPILHATEIYSLAGVNSFFSLLSQENASVVSLVISFILSFILPTAVFLLLLGFFYSKSIWEIRGTLGRILGGALWVLIAAAFFFAVIPEFGSGKLSMQGTTIVTFSGIVFAYIFVGALEESLKHFSIHPSLAGGKKTRSELVLLTVYTALGFVFLENSMYLVNIAETSDILGKSYMGTFFSRSIVSLLLHIFASVILVLGFSRWYENGSFRSCVQFGMFFLWSIGVHAAFNISLTYGKTGIIVLYAIVGYFFFTKVFFDERKEATL